MTHALSLTFENGLATLDGAPAWFAGVVKRFEKERQMTVCDRICRGIRTN